MTLIAGLLIVAFILFVISALPVSSPVNLTSLGLACWVLAIILEKGLL